MKEFLKDLVDFITDELATAAQFILVAIGVFGAFAAYAIYFGG